MDKSNFGTQFTPGSGCDVEPESATDQLGQAAATAEDLAAEGSGKKLLESTSEGHLPVEKESESRRIKVSLDPICGMSVDEMRALQVERDGSTYYFCSERCRQTFLATIAGVNPTSN